MKNLLFILVTLLFIDFAHAQKWENIIGVSGRKDMSGRITEHYDHGYLICAKMKEGYANMHGWLIKTDINGEVLWDKQIAVLPDKVKINKILSDNQGNMYIFGWLLDRNFPHEFPLVLKLNACGEKLWCRMLVFEGYEFGFFKDAMFLANGDLLGLASLEAEDYLQHDKLFLVQMSPDGEFKWKKSYASKDNHPLFANRSGASLDKCGDYYIITGYVYSPYPNGNPTHVFLRPMFIGIDELFREKWVVEYGIADSLLGKAERVIAVNDTLFMGIGRYRFVENGIMDMEAWLMFFNHKGEQVGYHTIKDEQLGSGVLESCFLEIEHIEDDKYFATASFLVDEPFNYEAGEMVIDTAGNVYNCTMDDRTWGGGANYLQKTYDNKYILASDISQPGQTTSNISLRKINQNLEHDTLYPGNYTYDSLCRHTIESGIIDLAGCDVITSIGEVPTLEEYRKGLQSIPIKASPNPSGTGEVLLEYKNTESFANLELRVTNIYGKQIHTETVLPYQGATRLHTHSWPTGMYIATIYSNGQVRGKCKVVVESK